MTIREASQLHQIPHQTIRKWVKSPDNCFNITLEPRSKHSIEKKVEMLKLYEESHLSINKFASIYDLKPTTLRNWIDNKDRLLAIYSSQRRSPVQTGIMKDSGKKAESMNPADEQDANQHIRDLKYENQYLKVKVAYLEALMELQGVHVPDLKKKLNTKLSKRSSHKESET